ncbi:MAG: hypothetical protein B2I17_05465 [Thermoplasmatales archaeon B_DKE]|nr:MAG: hypothetical protein B2I17_05465 [Thermoplasmatales archaeon B_DKE]
MIGTDQRKWSRIVFTGEDLQTDMLLYRDRAYLLIPSHGEENTFMTIAGDERTTFYVSSTSFQDHANVKEFFRRIYPCDLQESDPPDIRTEKRITLVNSFLNKRVREFFFGSLISSVINFSRPFKGSTLMYAVKIRSYTDRIRREKRFSFVVFLSVSENESMSPELENIVRQNLRRMRKESGWRMKIKRGTTIRFRANTLSNPFCLNPFVSIPEDEH